MHQPIDSSEVEKAIAVLKVSSGEHIIAVIQNETNSFLDLMHPYRIWTSMTQSGNISMTIVKWDISVDETHPIRVFKSNLISCAKPNNIMISNYKEALTSVYEEDDEESSTEEDLDKIESALSEMIQQSSKKDTKLH
jgi:hypothetical protein